MENAITLAVNGEPITVKVQRKKIKRLTLRLDKTGLRYNGTNFDNPTIVKNGNVTTYTYTDPTDKSDDYVEEHTDRIFDLSKIVVTVTTASNGQQTVKMVIPDSVLPTYTPELEGMDYYYEMLPARLIYQVGLTDEAKQDVLDLQKTGGTLTFYTNDFTGTTPENIEPDAVSTLHPSMANPFYHTQKDKDGNVVSTPAYAPHTDVKSDNPTETAENHIVCNLHYTDVIFFL